MLTQMSADSMFFIKNHRMEFYQNAVDVFKTIVYNY